MARERERYGGVVTNRETRRRSRVKVVLGRPLA